MVFYFQSPTKFSLFSIFSIFNFLKFAWSPRLLFFFSFFNSLFDTLPTIFFELRLLLILLLFFSSLYYKFVIPTTKSEVGSSTRQLVKTKNILNFQFQCNILIGLKFIYLLLQFIIFPFVCIKYQCHFLKDSVSMSFYLGFNVFK